MSGLSNQEANESSQKIPDDAFSLPMQYREVLMMPVQGATSQSNRTLTTLKAVQVSKTHGVEHVPKGSRVTCERTPDDSPAGSAA